MKKWLYGGIAVCALIISLLSIHAVSAQNLGNDLVGRAASSSGYSAVTETSFSQNVGKAISIILSLLGIIFTILFIYAGYLWMTAAGSDEKVTKAKSIMTSSIIGLIILLMAYSITAFVIPRVMKGSLQDQPSTIAP